MQQQSLFDAFHAPPVLRPIDPGGSTVRGDVDEVLRLPHPRLAWAIAEIELHRHTDGLWMWATSANCGESGYGYRVGPKWGQFAETREDALFYARREMAERIAGRQGPHVAAILAWLDGLGV